MKVFRQELLCIISNVGKITRVKLLKEHITSKPYLQNMLQLTKD